jgi:hypothetical protein
LASRQAASDATTETADEAAAEAAAVAVVKAAVTEAVSQGQRHLVGQHAVRKSKRNVRASGLGTCSSKAPKSVSVVNRKEGLALVDGELTTSDIEEERKQQAGAGKQRKKRRLPSKQGSAAYTREDEQDNGKRRIMKGGEMMPCGKAAEELEDGMTKLAAAAAAAAPQGERHDDRPSPAAAAPQGERHDDRPSPACLLPNRQSPPTANAMSEALAAAVMHAMNTDMAEATAVQKTVQKSSVLTLDLSAGGVGAATADSSLFSAVCNNLAAGAAHTLVPPLSLGRALHQYQSSLEHNFYIAAHPTPTAQQQPSPSTQLPGHLLTPPQLQHHIQQATSSSAAPAAGASESQQPQQLSTTGVLPQTAPTPVLPEVLQVVECTKLKISNMMKKRDEDLGKAKKKVEHIFA